MEKKVCLITGGTSGIGKYTALAMKSAGYAVFEISRRESMEFFTFLPISRMRAPFSRQ